MKMAVYHPVHDIDGISEFLIKKQFEFKFGEILVVFSSKDLEIFDNAIVEVKPEIIVLHCHDRSGNFQKIRDYTKVIRKKFGQALLFVDHDDNIEFGYYKTNIWGYEADHIVRTHGGMFFFDDRTWEIIRDHLCEK